jgi:hypothetical protein
VARPARALCGGLIADVRGGLGFDGSNEGSSFGVPAAGACHRDDGWSPLPNKRMKLTLRAGILFGWKSVTRMVCLDSSRTRSAAYARVR